MNETTKIKVTLEDAKMFANSTVEVNENNEVLVTLVRNGVEETTIMSTHETAEEAEEAEECKIAYEYMVDDFKRQITGQVAEEMNQ